MFDYRKGKIRYIPNELGSLYLDKTKVTINERPVIYIGGQMEHRWHVLEQTGKTFDPGHNMFTGNWFYDYSIFSDDKEAINAKNFAKNLKESLCMANLGDVDLVTHSFGGMIGALATDSDRIHKVYAVHPPITGTPLANPKILDQYKGVLDNKLLVRILKLLINTNYGFEKDNFTGADLKKVDLNKLVVIGSGLDPNVEKGYVLDLYKMIKTITGLENDGVVTYSEELFDRLGINYVTENGHYNHFNSGTEKAFEEAYQISRRSR